MAKRRPAELDDAFLWNCVVADVVSNPSAIVKKGELTEGSRGFVVAEKDVHGFEISTTEFVPNRQCEWEGEVLPCMAKPSVPTVALTQRELEKYNANYVVADLITEEARRSAARVGLQVFAASNHRLVNLEITRFEPQDHRRRAILLPSNSRSVSNGSNTIRLKRSDLETSRRTLESLLPKPDTRRLCMEFLANAILLAHEMAPDGWGVTLLPDCVRLNLGRIEILAIFRDQIHVVLSKQVYNNEIESLEGVQGTAISKTLYKSVSGSFSRDFPAQLAPVALEAVKPAFEYLITEAARTQRHPMTNKAHSSGVPLYLSDFLNTFVPQPAYSPESKQWNQTISMHALPEEVSVVHFEGETRQITVNAYERNPLARQECVDAFGARCAVCQMSFAEEYGPLFEGFIHVHHLKMISKSGGKYKVDPLKDLKPVCPNCHAVIHLKANEPRSIEDVIQLRLNAKKKI